MVEEHRIEQMANCTADQLNVPLLGCTKKNYIIFGLGLIMLYLIIKK